jgi:hypothetical protein
MGIVLVRRAPQFAQAQGLAHHSPEAIASSEATGFTD